MNLAFVSLTIQSLLNSSIPIGPGTFLRNGYFQYENAPSNIEAELTKSLEGRNQNVSTQIINYLTKDGSRGKGEAFRTLADITDRFGPRMAGTQNYADAASYVIEQLSKEGFDNVHGEPAWVPKWVRGSESAEMLSPRRKQLNMLGLGGSVPTPGNRSLTADIVVVTSFQELDRMGAIDRLAGKIVVFNQKYRNYGQSVSYRRKGASAASRYGAVAALIRTATPNNYLGTVATGQMDYAPGEKRKIPAAAISVEDAMMLGRLYRSGERVRVSLLMTCHSDGMVQDDNVVAEITGTQYPNEVVLISGHFDSWDVGTGAEDDFGGVMMAWETLRTIKALGLRPKRTIRAVFWAAEEQDLYGSKSYYKGHKNTSEKFVFVAESDEGAFAPNGLSFSPGSRNPTSATATGAMQAILNLAKALNPDGKMELRRMGPGGGEDVAPWIEAGCPGVWLENPDKAEYYFGYHHTSSDTASVFKPEDLDTTSALWTIMSFIASDIDSSIWVSDKRTP